MPPKVLLEKYISGHDYAMKFYTFSLLLSLGKGGLPLFQKIHQEDLFFGSLYSSQILLVPLSKFMSKFFKKINQI